jgi:hypothetical protein
LLAGLRAGLGLAELELARLAELLAELGELLLDVLDDEVRDLLLDLVLDLLNLLCGDSGNLRQDRLLHYRQELACQLLHDLLHDLVDDLLGYLLDLLDLLRRLKLVLVGRLELLWRQLPIWLLHAQVLLGSDRRWEAGGEGALLVQACCLRCHTVGGCSHLWILLGIGWPTRVRPNEITVR